MKTVGIATITVLEKCENAYNFGNKLQAYALQEFLRQSGYRPETIKYISTTPDYTRNSSASQKRSYKLSQIIDDSFRIINRHIHSDEIAHKRNEREKKFDAFVRSNISHTDEVYCADSDFSALNDKYDCFITGSDQVWNPYFEGSNEFYYLTFAPNGKRISYAPSIAVEQIPEQIKEQYGQWLKGIDYLSVREDAGAELLKRAFGVDAKLVCDPVFLLDKKQWEKLAIKPNVSEKYFLVYILGKKSVETKKAIRRLEKKLGLKAIDAYTRDDRASYFAGPKDFLGLIQNAEFVFTDSFHGTAFSVIFGRPVVSVERKSANKMNSRIDSLFRLLNVSNRSLDYLLENIDQIYTTYDNTAKLDKLICESKQYLLSALENE